MADRNCVGMRREAASAVEDTDMDGRPVAPERDRNVVALCMDDRVRHEFRHDDFRSRDAAEIAPSAQVTEDVPRGARRACVGCEHELGGGMAEIGERASRLAADETGSHASPNSERHSLTRAFAATDACSS